jgi:hypothetical protein
LGCIEDVNGAYTDYNLCLTAFKANACIGLSLPTAIPITPTAIPITPTATPITPTATPITPTATPITPTATPMSPTALATLSTPTGIVLINGYSVNLNNVPNTNFPSSSYFQIFAKAGNTNFVNSPSLVIKPSGVPLTIAFNNTNGGGCGTYTAKIVRYVGNSYWGGTLNTALIASYVNSPINNLPTENYSVSLTGITESVKVFCTARDPETEGFCIDTSISFNLEFS